jgi:hypothetical protein
MRKSAFSAALVLLAVIAWFGLQGSPPRAADSAKPAVQKFEYKTVDWGSAQYGLNQYGAEGWELCGVVPDRSATINSTVILKRPKQ